MRDISGSFRRVRKRFGIAAPRMQVHSQLPWYWRWLLLTALLAVSAAGAAWIYDAGRRFAGFEQSVAQTELDELRRDLSAARIELDKLRAVANAADSRLSIERAAQQKLAQQIRTLEQDNTRLREDLATFESMLSTEARSVGNLSIYRFKVEPDLLPGEYRYQLLLVTPRALKEREFKGRLELIVTLSEGGQNAMMSFPEQGEAGAAAFKLNFRYFRRVEGTFRVSPRAKVESVQARIYESGSAEPRATNSVSL